MTHDEAAQLLGAFALDAVDEDEAALIEAHVAECPRCEAELAEHREVAGMLGDMGGDAPRELWDRIASQATRPDVVQPAVPSIAEHSVRGHRRPARRAPLVAACVLALAGAVTIGLMASQISSLNAKVSSLASLSSRRGIALAEEAALLRPSTQRVILVGGSSGPHRIAEVVLVPGGQSYFVNVRLAGLPRSETYQLWAVAAHGSPVSLGLLGARPTVVPFVVNKARPTALLAVTVERAAGVVAPSGSPVAVSTSSV